MKIICVDNFDRETIPDRLLCTEVSKNYGQIIVDALNEKLSGNRADFFYRLVPDDYKLRTFEP